MTQGNIWPAKEALTAYQAAYLKPSNSLLSDLLNTRRRLVLEAMRDVPPGCRILEVGCGFGPILRALCDAGYQNLGGCDLERQVIEKARRYVPEAELLETNAESLPYEDASKDVVISVGVLNYLQEPQRAVAEMRRVLRPDGRLILSSANALSCARLVLFLGALARFRRPAVRQFRYFRYRQVLAMLDAAGLVDAECEFFCHLLPFRYRWPVGSWPAVCVEKLTRALQHTVGSWWGHEFLLTASAKKG